MAAARFSSAMLLARWQRLRKSQQIAVGILGSLALIGLVDLVALRPIRNRLRALAIEVKQTEQKLRAATEANDNALNVSKAFKNYASYAAASASADVELANLLSDVETTLRQSGVILLNLKPAQRSKENVISIAVDGESSAEQLMRMLDAFQRSQRALKITELSIRVSESKTLRVAMVVSKLLIQ